MIFVSSAPAYDAPELIRSRLAEAGHTNLSAIVYTTNRHSGTISCRIQCADNKDVSTVIQALRSLPDKLRISQASNAVVVVVRTPQEAQQWQGQQAVNRASDPSHEAEPQESATSQKNQGAIRERERLRDLEAINQLRASIRSARQKNSDGSQIGVAQARIDGQEHQLAQMIAAYKGKYGQEP